MKCIKCSKETNNEQEICEKCLKKEENKRKKEELKQAKKDMKKAKFEQIDIDEEIHYGQNVLPTGLRSSIVSISSSVAAIVLSLLILPGFIFGFLALVEGIITIVDVIRNNKRGKRRMLPLALAIMGIIISGLAIVFAFVSALSVLIYILSGFAFGLVALLIAIIA